MSKVLADHSAAATPPGRSVLSGLLQTARVRQWSKNVLVFAAPAAAGVLSHPGALGRSSATFALFCLVSSGTYFFNDAIDVRADRAHPVKRNRPVAAGVISVAFALRFGVTLMVLSTAAAAVLTWRLSLVLGIYAAVQIAYTLYLKHEPVLDMVSVASGFVLRAIAGAVAIPVPVSQWFLIVATFGSLVMVAGKRVAEYAELGDSRGAHRRALESYTPTFLRIVLGVSAAGAIIGYCLWAFSLQTAMEHHHDPIWFQLSFVPAIIGLFRYVYLVESGKGARPEELVFSDRQLQVIGVTWTVLFAVGVYAG